MKISYVSPVFFRQNSLNYLIKLLLRLLLQLLRFQPI